MKNILILLITIFIFIGCGSGGGSSESKPLSYSEAVSLYNKLANILKDDEFESTNNREKRVSSELSKIGKIIVEKKLSTNYDADTMKMTINKPYFIGISASSYFGSDTVYFERARGNIIPISSVNDENKIYTTIDIDNKTAKKIAESFFMKVVFYFQYPTTTIKRYTIDITGSTMMKIKTSVESYIVYNKITGKEYSLKIPEAVVEKPFKENENYNDITDINNSQLTFTYTNNDNLSSTTRIFNINNIGDKYNNGDNIAWGYEDGYTNDIFREINCYARDSGAISGNYAYLCVLKGVNYDNKWLGLSFNINNDSIIIGKFAEDDDIGKAMFNSQNSNYDGYINGQIKTLK